MNDADLDTLWQEACEREETSFGDWMGRVERPIRLSLQRWARFVDVEGILQESYVRMWVRAGDSAEPPLTGTNASLRFAIVMAKNLARNEAPKHYREEVLPPEQMPEGSVDPAPDPEPALGRAIVECLEALGGRLREVLVTRLADEGRGPDRELAASLGMRLNTFLQNIVRARRQIDACLDDKGFPAKERTA